ncbi:MAG TPA: wax ester/triacylglycerol synthase family O-acyltransferase [Solirubrobacterales bacterium]|jgi:WS/DGAT/MGAT family acyltransferase
MAAADAAWLHMDRSTNPMVVNGLDVLAEAPDPDRARELLEERLVDRFPRFSQRIADPLGRTPAFEDDPNFDIANHLHRIALPAPGDDSALFELVGDLVTPPLDPTRPLWHSYLIEGYGEGAAVLWRIHHCIADGIALARVLLATTDDGDAAIESAVPDNGSRGVLGRLADIPRAAGSTLRAVGDAALHQGIETAAHPDHLRQLAGTALEDLSTTAKLLGAPADAASDLRAPLTGRRRVFLSEPIPLSRVKAAARRRGVTINDLLLTALAGALHEELGGSAGTPEEIHVMVPFNLRALDEPVSAELGNDFALILLQLPIGRMDAAERLGEVQSRMSEIKDSHEAPISYGILSAIGMTPPWMEDRLIGFFSNKASLVVTNVPGPGRRLHFAGAPVERVMVWAPPSGNLGLTVSIFSYAGEVTSGFMADTGLVDPEPLARAYESELRVLCE